MRRSVNLLLLLFFICQVVFAVFSYALVDPNLVISSHPIYWQFQNWMWQTFFHNSVLLTQTYLLIVTIWFVIFLWIITLLRREKISDLVFKPEMIVGYLLLIFPMLLAYNALSHDVFNYIFNAKMVMVYHVDPHQAVALDYAADDWTRFMHNTHTPAPYGYGWTIVSVLPFLLGGGKFMTTWLAFRLISLLSLSGLLWVLQLLAKSWLHQPLKLWQLSLVFLNPLLIIEVLGNSHNDLWMMVPAAGAMWCLTQINNFNKASLKWLLLAVMAFFLSVSIKYATLVLLPLLLLIMMEKVVMLNLRHKIRFGLFNLIPEKAQQYVINWVDEKLIKYLPLFASMFMFLPLLTLRSQQFHPWYLIWPLIWLPLIKTAWWRQLLLVFSISSLWRYAPWLLQGGYEGEVLFYQKLITWLPAGLYLFYLLGKRSKSQKNHPQKVLPLLKAMES